MRLFIIMFLFAVGVMRAADSYSQNVLLDIEVQNQTIEKVLGEIEKQSEFTFFYNDKQINVNRLVSVTVTKETIFKVFEGGNLAASKIRNLECPNYEICLIDYGCGKFNRKIHIMEQYP